MFELLMDVPKIGPKSALQVMNQASPTLLVEAISKKDAQYLHKLSGIGKKTCENIVQFLHDKVEGMAFASDLQVVSNLTDAQTDAQQKTEGRHYQRILKLRVHTEILARRFTKRYPAVSSKAACSRATCAPSAPSSARPMCRSRAFSPAGSARHRCGWPDRPWRQAGRRRRR